MTRRAIAMMLLASISAGLVSLSAGPAHAATISGFMCLSRPDAESMLVLNAAGAEIDDYSKEDARGRELTASGACHRIPDAMPIEAYEVYRGPVVLVKGGPAKQIVGFAREPGGMAELWGLDFALAPSLRGPVPEEPKRLPARPPGQHDA